MIDLIEEKMSTDEKVEPSSDLKQYVEDKIREYLNPVEEKLDRTRTLILQKIPLIDFLEAKMKEAVPKEPPKAIEKEPKSIIEGSLTAEQLGQKFNELSRKWKDETINLSSMQQIALNFAYQEIIGLGPRAISLILNQLKREPDFWFWALRALTRANPVTEEMYGDLEAMTKAWIDWGREHAYL